MNILDNLDMLLNERNLSRRKFAFEINVSPSTVHSWYQRGFENISLDYLVKISNYFNITIDELVYGKIEKNIYAEYLEELIKHLEYKKDQVISMSNVDFTFKCNVCENTYVIPKRDLYKKNNCPYCEGELNEGSNLY